MNEALLCVPLATFLFPIPWSVTLAAACVFSYLVGRVTIDAAKSKAGGRTSSERQSHDAAIELKHVVDHLHEELDEHHTHMSHLRREIANLDASQSRQVESAINDEAKRALESTVRLVNQVMRAYDDIRRQTMFLKRIPDSSKAAPVEQGDSPSTLNESLTQMFAMQARYDLPLSIARIALGEDRSPQGMTQSPRTRKEGLDQLVLVVQGVIRDTDVMHRDAEGTIVVLLPNTDSDAALLFAKRLTVRVAMDMNSTLCVGVAAAGDVDDPQAIMGRTREAVDASRSRGTAVCYHDGENIHRIEADHDPERFALATAGKA